MKAKATVRLRLSLEKQLTTIFAALTPEAQKPVGTRAVASLVREGSFLVLKVEAKDTVALRAALNAYLINQFQLFMLASSTYFCAFSAAIETYPFIVSATNHY
jgi:tRNA threonylcarbamoyladenosine modification (KEOPS) complex  Pcc1 subunit